ncbi:hypothetical protein M3599_16455 [Niallia circulans]|uniref:hypothetical protein n=1 Tax=Niallia circulans TaxID=1397 RepID=UPI00204184EB|nr:hypothetical protein [Niallia circulans]MCM2982517.1 hypothetical protein [Niallia circulans]
MIIEKKADFLLGGGDYAQSTLCNQKALRIEELQREVLTRTTNQYNVHVKKGI